VSCNKIIDKFSLQIYTLPLPCFCIAIEYPAAEKIKPVLLLSIILRSYTTLAVALEYSYSKTLNALLKRFSI
jgi:hypothetical protein